MRQKIIIGNWKMYKNSQEVEDFIIKVDSHCANSPMQLGIAVPFVYLEQARQQAQNLAICAQNCHFDQEGAYTGEISPMMLNDLQISYAIIGHSERRAMFNETDKSVNKKIHALLEHNITPIVCCGESLEQYERGETNEIVTNQLTIAFQGVNITDVAKIVIAYEPIWAIGTGKTATPEIAENVAITIRNHLEGLYDQTTSQAVRIQYGGSVKPENIGAILAQPNIDGALIGGASLDPTAFLKMISF